MGRRSEIKNSRLVTFNLDFEEYQKLLKNLTDENNKLNKDVNVSDWIREQIRFYNEGKNIEKNLNPLNLRKKGIVGKDEHKGNNTTLDTYININDQEKHDLSKKIHNLEDKETLYKIRDNANMVKTIAHTRIMNITKGIYN